MDAPDFSVACIERQTGPSDCPIVLTFRSDSFDVT